MKSSESETTREDGYHGAHDWRVLSWRTPISYILRTQSDPRGIQERAQQPAVWSSPSRVVETNKPTRVTTVNPICKQLYRRPAVRNRTKRQHHRSSRFVARCHCLQPTDIHTRTGCAVHAPAPSDVGTAQSLFRCGRDLGGQNVYDLKYLPARPSSLAQRGAILTPWPESCILFPSKKAVLLRDYRDEH